MISTAEKTKLKGEGFLPQKDDGYFSVRVLSKAGNFTCDEIIKIAEIAKSYGKGYLGLTTRLTTEIPWIKYEDIPKVKEELTKNNLRHGGTGKRVRPLVACKGTVCPQGLYDTQKLCMELHDKFFAYNLPAKFKITLVGCPNNCARASLNDIGIVGQAYVEFNENKCKACGLCVASCRQKSLTRENDKVSYNNSTCVNCGKCAQVCPFGAITVKEEGLKIFVGGRSGREIRMGSPLNGLYKYEEIPSLVQKIFDFHTDNGNDGERLSKLLDRIGFEKLQDFIDNN